MWKLYESTMGGQAWGQGAAAGGRGASNEWEQMAQAAASSLCSSSSQQMLNVDGKEAGLSQQRDEPRVHLIDVREGRVGMGREQSQQRGERVRFACCQLLIHGRVEHSQERFPLRDSNRRGAEKVHGRAALLCGED